MTCVHDQHGRIAGDGEGGKRRRQTDRAVPDRGAGRPVEAIGQSVGETVDERLRGKRSGRSDWRTTARSGWWAARAGQDVRLSRRGHASCRP